MDLSNRFNLNRQRTQEQESGRARAEREMREKTIAQGKHMAFMHVQKQVDERTPEWMRSAAGIVCPNWLHAFWMGAYKVMLFVTMVIWKVISFVFLYPLLKRISQILMRGGHVARINHGPNEWVVKIKISKWWKVVYECDFDVRNGSVSEVIKDPEQSKK